MRPSCFKSGWVCQKPLVQVLFSSYCAQSLNIQSDIFRKEKEQETHLDRLCAVPRHPQWPVPSPPCAGGMGHAKADRIHLSSNAIKPSRVCHGSSAHGARHGRISRRLGLDPLRLQLRSERLRATCAVAAGTAPPVVPGTAGSTFDVATVPGALLILPRKGAMVCLGLGWLWLWLPFLIGGGGGLALPLPVGLPEWRLLAWVQPNPDVLLDFPLTRRMPSKGLRRWLQTLWGPLFGTSLTSPLNCTHSI